MVHPTTALKFVATSAILLSGLAYARGQESNTGYVTPPWTLSPDHRYGVMVPVFHIDKAEEPDDRKNKVIEIRTGRVVAVIKADPGYDRALNFHDVVPPRWSRDGSVLLWKIAGKWNPDALVLLKIEKGREKWQLDLLKTAQQVILTRTKEAAPEKYAVVKDAKGGSGSAFPDGFAIDVITDYEGSKTVLFPLGVHVDLTSNPKQIEDLPTLKSELSGFVTKDGKFKVKKFQLSER